MPRPRKQDVSAVAHILQTFTDLDDDTIVSIDGVGTCDLISRNAIARTSEDGERRSDHLTRPVLFGRTSTCLWKDEAGDTQEIHRERATPLMPLGQHPALEQRRLRGKKKVFAFLSDIVVVCSLDRVVPVEAILREELKRHAHIDVHQCKTQVGTGAVWPGEASRSW